MATNAQEYLRIHIRADSNEDKAQAVKYLVRDQVVEYLTPLVANYQTQSQAVLGIQENLENIERVATQVLTKHGFSYGASASVEQEVFPTRIYGEYTLASGEYTALIIRLGSGKGDNWWCVVYPPLCFTSAHGENVIYKSKIMEIIEKWRT
jgi:stage II sporulation protein R